MSSRILTLEEDPVRVAELKTSIRHPGAQTFQFLEHSQGARLFVEQPVDLILCDVHLETLSAFDFLEDVKKSTERRGSPFLFYCIEPVS